MANARPTPAHPGPTPSTELVRHSDLALEVPTEAKARTDQVSSGSLPLAVKLYEVRKPFNQWLYGYFVELEQIGPLPVGPLPPEPHRCSRIDCIECWNAGVRYTDYLKAKAVRERNGF